MTETQTTRKEKSNVVSNYSELDQAVLQIHRDYDMAERGHDGLPYLEISSDLFDALLKGKGKQENSVTYSSPAVRLFRQGMMKSVVDEETLPADEFLKREIEKRSKAANKR